MLLHYVGLLTNTIMSSQAVVIIVRDEMIHLNERRLKKPVASLASS